MTCADQSRNPSDNPSANLLSQPLTQGGIPNIVQQVLPNIAQQVLPTHQPPKNTHVGQQMDSANRSLGPQQFTNIIELNATPSGVTDRTGVISNLPLSEQRTPNSSGVTTIDNSHPSISISTTPPNDPVATLPGLGKPSSELQ